MGSRIAAHIANAGLPVVLLDIVPPGTTADADKATKNKFVLAALDGLKKSKPAAFFIPENARLITLGNFDEDHPTSAEMRSCAKLVAYLMRTYHIAPDHVIGHNDTKPTDCPGRYMSVASVRAMAMAINGQSTYAAGPAHVRTAETTELLEPAGQ